MPLVFRVGEVFRTRGRLVLAVDRQQGVEEVRVGDGFRASDGTEFTVRAVSFSTAEAWEAGKRGLQVEVTKGAVTVGQAFERIE
jgi:hypothetical protein